MKNQGRIPAGLILGFALVACMASPARADLVLTGAITQIAAPASDIQNGGDPTSNSTAFLWGERTDLTLGGNVRVDMTGPGTSDSGNNYRPSNGIVAAGTAVDTYLIHSDPVRGSHEYIGTVTFDTAILGVIDTIGRLANTDAGLGSLTTTYPGNSTDRALEGTDTLTWSNDGRTLSFDFTTSGYVDEIRVLVASSAVPEPAAMISLATGVTLLAGFGRRRRARSSTAIS